MFVDVAVPGAKNPGKDFYTYFSDKPLKIGSLVTVPFGQKTVLGIVFANKTQSDVKKILPVLRIALPSPILDEKQLALLTWLCYFYRASMSQVITMALPKFSTAYLRKRNSSTQIGRKTASQTLLLVPTVQHLEVLAESLRRKGVSFVTYDGSMSENQRAATYLAVQNGSSNVVLATKIGLFLPFSRLKRLYLTDEHDWRYKEQRSPTYHAMDVALKLAALHHVQLRIRDTTPRVQTFYHATLEPDSGSPQIVLEKPPQKSLPKVAAVETKPGFSERDGILSDQSQALLHRALAKNLPVLLFLNRKNDGGMTKCQHCGYFGYTAQAPVVCPSCGKPAPTHTALNLKAVGRETNRLLKSWGLGQGRWQSLANGSIITYSTTQAGHSSNSPLITIATQKIFSMRTEDRFSLGVSVMADSLISVPEFRSNEKAFAQLTELRNLIHGRGILVLQTANQNQPIFHFFASNRYDEFAKNELSERKMLGYPPFRQLALCSFSAKTEQTTKSHAETLANQLQKIIAAQSNGKQIELTGPFSTLHNPLQVRILLKGKRREDFDDVLAAVPQTWKLDFDPENIVT